MRGLYSWGAAALIIIILALWMGTGTLIRGGQGPGLGEKPVVALVEPKGGPITKTLDKTGIQGKAASEEPNEPNPDITIAQREAKAVGAKAPVRSVEVKTYTAEPMPIQVVVRGETKAKATVNAAAETTGTVQSVAVEKGQAVKDGDLLCTLDPGTRQAAVTQAQANLDQAKVGVDKAQADYDTNQQLRSKGLAAPNTERQLQVALESAKAAVSSAQAALDNAKQELARTKIYAKSAGIIDTVANVGQMLSSGSACATIVELNPITFAGSIPEARIGAARPGMTASVKTVTGQTLEGKVTYIAPVADNATRTFPVEIDMPNPDYQLRAGVTAEATIEVGSAPAQMLPQSSLTLDDNGTVGVRAVDANSKVVFYPVTIVKDAREGMYVTGLPPKVDVITVGQEFVKAGDTVKAVQDLGKSSVGPTSASEGANS